MFVDRNGVLEGSLFSQAIIIESCQESPRFRFQIVIRIKMIPTEHPPSKVSSILMMYDEVKDNIHPVVVNYYAKDIERYVAFIIKVPTTNEELKQELRTSIKSAKKCESESDSLAVAFAEDNESLGV